MSEDSKHRDECRLSGGSEVLGKGFWECVASDKQNLIIMSNILVQKMFDEVSPDPIMTNTSIDGFISITVFSYIQ